MKTRIRHYTNLGKTYDPLSTTLQSVNLPAARKAASPQLLKTMASRPGDRMVQDEEQQIADYWDRRFPQFDAIYSGKKNPLARSLDHWLRRDIYERFDWVMRKAGDSRNLTVCDVGCGSGRFVAALAQCGDPVTGLDFAPQMLDLPRDLAEQTGVADRCNFVLSDLSDWKTSNKFDLVIAIGFWDYVAAPLERLQVIRGITCDRFLSACPRAGAIGATIRKRRLKAGCPVYFWTHTQVEEYLTKTGFSIESYEIYGQLFSVGSKAV
jgi:SAM-dependent methyltransferase